MRRHAAPLLRATTASRSCCSASLRARTGGGAAAGGTAASRQLSGWSKTSAAGEEPAAFDPVAALNTTSKDAAGAAGLYDDWAASYDQTLSDWGYEAPARTAELLAEHMHGCAPAAAGLPVLDCGCGTGLSSSALAAAGLTSLVGVDLANNAGTLSVCVHPPHPLAGTSIGM